VTGDAEPTEAEPWAG